RTRLPRPQTVPAAPTSRRVHRATGTPSSPVHQPSRRPPRRTGPSTLRTNRSPTGRRQQRPAATPRQRSPVPPTWTSGFDRDAPVIRPARSARTSPQHPDEASAPSQPETSAEPGRAHRRTRTRPRPRRTQPTPPLSRQASHAAGGSGAGERTPAPPAQEPRAPGPHRSAHRNRPATATPELGRRAPPSTNRTRKPLAPPGGRPGG